MIPQLSKLIWWWWNQYLNRNNKMHYQIAANKYTFNREKDTKQWFCLCLTNSRIIVWSIDCCLATGILSLHFFSDMVFAIVSVFICVYIHVDHLQCDTLMTLISALSFNFIQSILNGLLVLHGCSGA